MNSTPPEPGFGNASAYSDSLDTILIISEGPGDNTIRPIRPQFLQHAIELREQLARYEEAQRQHPPARPAGASDVEITEL